MCWECKVRGSLSRSRLASGVQWFQGCILHLEASYSCSQSVLTVWHSGGYKWATKTTNALTQHQLSDVRNICFTGTRCRYTLAPSCSQRKVQSSRCRAARNTWGRVLSSQGRPARTEPPARHPADFRRDAELLCHCFVCEDFKEHLITCSYVSRSWHLSILLSWL